jgi:hypothetical protein
MSDKPEPRTLRELYIYTEGEFEAINQKLDAIYDKMKLVFLIGGFAGSIFSAIVIGLLKLVGFIN